MVELVVDREDFDHLFRGSTWLRACLFNGAVMVEYSGKKNKKGKQIVKYTNANGYSITFPKKGCFRTGIKLENDKMDDFPWCDLKGNPIRVISLNRKAKRRKGKFFLKGGWRSMWVGFSIPRSREEDYGVVDSGIHADVYCDKKTKDKRVDDFEGKTEYSVRIG